MNGRYDVCVYCFAPGCETGTAVHAMSCPMVTGLYPVTDDDVQKGMCCTECGQPFGSGDVYTHLRTEEPEVFMAACISCQILMKGVAE